MTSVVWSATRVPRRNAPTNATIPMLTGRIVAITNIATSARIESNSGDTTHLLGADPGQRHGRLSNQETYFVTGRRRRRQCVAFTLRVAVCQRESNTETARLVSIAALRRSQSD